MRRRNSSNYFSHGTLIRKSEAIRAIELGTIKMCLAHQTRARILEKWILVSLVKVLFA